MTKPTQKPANPRFSSGPTTKHAGWSIDKLSDAALGRSHRSAIGKQKLKEVIELSREVLGIPADWRLAIVPASDTGAMEMAMWSMLGARGVDVLAWESFSADWVTDCRDQLKLEDIRVMEADYGHLPDLSQVDWSRDVVFPWNGTTGGARVPNGDWIAQDRAGLAICDATSAVFAMDMPWDKLDVVTWSWQKVMGGEAAHGMLALSPRAVERLESYTPSWPLPKLFRMTKKGKINESLFEGATINTPSMLAVEDQIVALNWAKSLGGGAALIARSEANLAAVKNWVENTSWIDFLAADPATLSCTSICLKIVDADYQALPKDEQAAVAKQMLKMLEAENVALDAGAYRTAPAGFRIWGGGTVEASDIEVLLPWLDWAWGEVKANLKQVA